MKFIAKLILSLVSIIAVVAIAVLGVYLYVRSSFGIDIFKTVGQLNTLNERVDESILCPNAFSDSDMQGVMSEVNGSVENLITYSEQDGYSVTLENISSTMDSDIKLSDKQVGALMQTIINQVTSDGISVGGKSMPIELKQVKFSELSQGKVNVNCVVKLDVTPFKAEMKGFPFNYLSKYVPDNLYLSSSVTVVKGGEAFAYTTENAVLSVSNLSVSDTQDLFHTLDVVLKIGSASDMAEKLSTTLIGTIIGSQSQTGFAYSLKPIGATDYEFISVSDQIYFTVKK